MKNLTQKEYSPTTKAFNLQEVIKKQVDKESWAIVDIKQPELPKYQKVKINFTATVIEAFSKGIHMFSI